MAYVKVSEQTACCHYLIFVTFRHAFEHPLPSADSEPYHPMMDWQCQAKEFSGSSFVRISANCSSVGVACTFISWRSNETTGLYVSFLGTFWVSVLIPVHCCYLQRQCNGSSGAICRSEPLARWPP